MKNKLFIAILIASSLSSLRLTGQALNFDGANDYVEVNSVADDFAGLNTFTVEFWMKADKNLQTSVRVGLFAVNDTNAPPADNIFIITMGGLNSQDGKLLIVDNVTGFDFVSTTVIGDNVCHHIAYVRNQGTSSMYIDGTLVGTHVPDYSFLPNHRFSLGHEWDYGNPSDLYKGTLEDVRFWNTARTSAEIVNNMNIELNGTEAGLIAYYPFNQGMANGTNTGLTTLVDFSSNGNNGTLNNFALTGSTSNWITACSADIQANSIHENEVRNLAAVYPNPVGDHLYIGGNYLAPLTVTIVDARGKTISTTTVSGYDPFIETSDLSPGIYFVYGEGLRSRFIKE